MARRDLLAGLLVTTIAAAGVLLFFVRGSWPGPAARAAEPARPPSESASGPTELELTLEEGLRRCQDELDEMRAELARIERRLDERTPIRAVEAPEIAQESPAPKSEV